MLQAIDISLARGETPLFAQLSCTIHTGQKVALVGRNGAGKSTLFDLLLGRLHADAGEVRVPADWRIAHMAQQVDVTDRPILDYVIDGHRELRDVQRRIAVAEGHDEPLELARLHGTLADLGGYEAEARAGEILNGLGFSADDFGRPFQAFSGGWRIRANLAQALMCPADLLLLDEPTNHLDLDTTLWLESWLIRFEGTLVIIAHDRDFLDAVTDHTIHLHHGRADTYRGNYSAFERQRAEKLLHQQAAFDKQQAEMRHMQTFIDRFRAKASKARQVQSRIKALERMQTAAPVHADSPYQFSFTNPDKMSNPLLVLDDVSLGYDDAPVLRDIRRSVLPGARIGVLGVNGAGKSTLLKCLVGVLEPLSGELVRGQHAKVGYFAQHQLETLRADRSALRQLADAHPTRREQWCRDYLGSWGFSGTQAERPVATYSGGEKARLALAMIALTQPALLVLDEPTNHLDLDMREALSLALQDYTGALLLVSHDRSLLKRSVDELWLVENGTVSTYGDDLDSYTSSRQSGSGRRPAQHDRREERRSAAEQRRREKPLRDQIRQQEREMESVGKRLEAVEARLADPQVYQNLPAEELDALLAESGRLRRTLEIAEEGWLLASAQLEELATASGNGFSG
ncbi:MAG: ATP-binding cassette domain-containing protein [Pseudomonadales bacterium]